jgi:hypothetical protein
MATTTAVDTEEPDYAARRSTGGANSLTTAM